MTREPPDEAEEPTGAEPPADAPVDPSPELAGAPRQRAYVPMSMAAFPTDLLDKAKKKKKGDKPDAAAPVAGPAMPVVELIPIDEPTTEELPAETEPPKVVVPPASGGNLVLILAAVGLAVVFTGAVLALLGILVIVAGAGAWGVLGG